MNKLRRLVDSTAKILEISVLEDHISKMDARALYSDSDIPGLSRVYAPRSTIGSCQCGKRRYEAGGKT